jgi:small subunit ribosomal protein S6
MATQPTIYDLMLLLSTTAEDSQRAKILTEVESAISKAGGSIERNDDWGRRPIAYQIRHQPEAEYHLLQFTAPPTLIEELSHTLRITDGVLRFRIIRLAPGVSAAPAPPPAGGRRGEAETAAPAPQDEPTRAQGGAQESASETPAVAEPA